MIEQTIFEEGVRLTAIGIGATFVLLTGMGVIIAIVGRVVGLGSKRGQQDGSPPSVDSDPKRGPALAAVTAVTALLEQDREMP